MDALSSVLAFVGIPLLRSVAGWFSHSVKDGRISKYEWKLLVETIINVGLVGIMIYVGLDQMGVNVSELGAASAAFVIDKLVSALKDNARKDKKQKN